MLLALIIRSNYAENGVVAAREAFEDTGAFVQSRLSDGRYGLNAVGLPANRELPEQLEQLLAEYAGELEGLIVHYAGYLALKPDRVPALLLDGARLRAFPISRLRAAIAAASRHAFVIMDAIAVAEHALDLNGVVSDLGAALSESAPHISVMSSIAIPEHREPTWRGCSRLSDLWLLSLDALARRACGATVYSEAVVRGVQSEPLGFANLSSFDYRPSEPDFVLLPGNKLGALPIRDDIHDRITLQSVLVNPADPSQNANRDGEDFASHSRANDTLPDDTLVDSRPATLVTDNDIVKDEAREPVSPISSRRPVVTERAPRPSQPVFENPVDRAIDWAERLAYRGDAASAVVEYERLIQELKPTADARLSTLYASLGVQYRKLDDDSQALTAFEEALALDPRDDVAHKGTTDIHREQRDWDSLSQTVRRRLHTSTDTHEKTDLLDRLADIWLNYVNDPKRAISVIEERLAITPNDIPTLERMIEAYDRDGEPFARIAQREKLASVLESSPTQKSLVLVESANIALQQLDDIETAQSFVDRAMQADPKSIEAFELGIEILNRQELWPEILRQCSRVLSDSSGPDLRYQAARMLLDLVEARGQSIDISDAVVDRLEVAVSDDEELKRRAMRVLAGRDAYAKTTATLRNSLALDPRNAASLRELSDAAAQQRDVDMAAIASSVLVCLQNGRPEDEERATALSTDRLSEAKRPLNDEDLTEQLLVHDVDISIFRVLGALQRSMGLNPELENDGMSSYENGHPWGSNHAAESISRTLAWAAGVVGVEVPAVVMLPDHKVPLELTLAGQPRLLVGVESAKRLAPPQLAFLGSYCVAQLRQEFVWRAALRTQERLTTVIGMCIRFARDGRSCVDVAATDQSFAHRFVAFLDTRSDISKEITQLFKDHAPVASVWEDLARRCFRAVDRSLLRVGVVVSTNPALAYQAAKLHPPHNSLSTEDQLDEIARFATSRDHQTLRRSLGFDVATATYRASKSTNPKSASSSASSTLATP
jgi:tetratricopeptide (TPR) repeat protein